MKNRAVILHLFGWDRKFVPSFIRFIKETSDSNSHLFIIYGPIGDGDPPTSDDIIYYAHPLRSISKIWAKLRSARKIIIHSLFNSHLLYILALHPWVLKRCYWVIWGGDLYVKLAENRDWRWRKNEAVRQFIIRRIGHLITHVKGDYELAHEWYGSKGEWHECFMYYSNVIQEILVQSLPHEGTHILLGNSADPSNNHIEVLEKLKTYAEDDIKIYCPLSYGNQSYAQNISDYATSIFGDKFIALRQFMPLKKYIELLAQIDIAIFNHKRQQGMGNATTLLAMGKKVYMRKGTTSRSVFRDLGITVYSIDNFDLSPIEQDIAKKNQDFTKAYFSEDRLKSQWAEIVE